MFADDTTITAFEKKTVNDVKNSLQSQFNNTKNGVNNLPCAQMKRKQRLST